MDAAGLLGRFRAGVYGCLGRRADALFELCDAVLCSPGAVTDLARLSLAGVFRRGHGALYDALNAGSIDTARLAALVACQPVEQIPGPGGRPRVVLAVDVSNWLRPDAVTSPERAFCHTYPRGRGQAQMIPGWKYSWVAALTPGASSWTALLDVRRLGPDDEETTATAGQLRQVLTRLRAAGHWQPGDPDVLVVMDSGYDGTRLAWLLADLPVTLVVRLRSDRVFHAPAGTRAGSTKGHPPRHGARLVLADQTTWPAPEVTTINPTDRYGSARTVAFARMHQRLTARGSWAGHDGELPIIEGTLIRLSVDYLPGDRAPDPVWLWVSRAAATDDDIDHWWSMFLRRFDLEHTFRMLKQTLGWTRPILRSPQAADRWTWLVLLAHTQLRLARPLVADHRLPWQPPLAADRLTPARVRADFPRTHRTTTVPQPHPNHPDQARDAHPAAETATKHPSNPSAKPPRVKRQA